MQIAEVRAKAQTIANNSTKQIVVAVYQKMIADHNELCGCNYCKLLERYICIKKSLTKQKRREGYCDYWDVRVLATEMQYTTYLRNEAEQLKIEKDKLKTL